MAEVLRALGIGSVVRFHRVFEFDGKAMVHRDRDETIVTAKLCGKPTDPVGQEIVYGTDRLTSIPHRFLAAKIEEGKATIVSVAGEEAPPALPLADLVALMDAIAAEPGAATYTEAAANGWMIDVDRVSFGEHPYRAVLWNAEDGVVEIREGSLSDCAARVATFRAQTKTLAKVGAAA